VWVVRELIRLVEKVAIAFAVALALAALWALVSSHSFAHDLRTTCLVVGALTLLAGAMPRDSPFERRLDYGVAEKAWGALPGFSSLRYNPTDPTIRPGVVLAASGLALLAFALFVL
jgi:hypothetical protein